MRQGEVGLGNEGRRRAGQPQVLGDSLLASLCLFRQPFFLSSFSTLGSHWGRSLCTGSGQEGEVKGREMGRHLDLESEAGVEHGDKSVLDSRMPLVARALGPDGGTEFRVLLRYVCLI